MTKKIIIVLMLLVFLLGRDSFCFDLKIKEGKWVNEQGFCGTMKLNIKRVSGGDSFSLVLIKFNPQKSKVKILRAQSLGVKITSARHLAQKSGAFCVINGGFFDENYNALGVLITGGKIIQYMPGEGNFSVFCVDKDAKPRIIHKNDFNYKGVIEALQSSPRLSVNGINTRGVYGPNEISRRSGIGLDGENNIVIYATDTIFDGLSFNELRFIFRLPFINLKTVLSLDGGRSTQLYFKLNGRSIDIAGFDNIPVGIGFFKK